eukprot:CAMPEP_0201713692 /NCGR_PEP_ID=MMETSP0593-20130828/441_1 /ASSEMBLY_ACC=CAM_ASM_000672 /TAXON_ID=267983 /ORGANISM="Skeletonema japonicum, Strain CCMP2506" /LENGTH=268 /DNA_ID=CAMNT_0048202869 /DNA_START=85 /DNA_END=891 /DNA_ORIENTATION=+
MTTITNFWIDKSPEVTPEGLPVPGRMECFMVGHCIFFMINFLNVCYLILFEEFTFQRLRKNILLQFGFVACFVQLFSCITSVHRYNIGDEYGIFNKAGVVIGIVAFTPLNFTDLYLIFQPKKNVTAIRLGMCFWVIAALANGYYSMVNWEESTTKPFQMLVGLSTLSHIVGLIVFRKYLKDGTVSIDDSIASKDVMLRMLMVLIILDCLCLFGATLGKPIISYPGTGLTFTVMVIAMSFIGRMDFMTAEGLGSSAMVGTERQPLKSAV